MASRRRAFTLVELLVVIAIISVLVALLFPVLSRARRSAVVLACPVVYESANHRMVIVHPTGRAELTLARSMTVDMNGLPAAPVWSPNGRWIGFGGSSRSHPAGEYHVAIMDPATGRVIRHYIDRGNGASWFIGWADDTHFIDSVGVVGGYRVRDAETGEVRATYLPADLRDRDGRSQVSPVPASTGWNYITTVMQRTRDGSDTVGHAIVFLRRDFGRGKTVWVEAGSPRVPFPSPQVDPTGEYVAWTRRQKSGGSAVAFKGAREPAGREPGWICTEYGHAAFCDWTGDSKILASVVQGSRSKLLVFDLNGTLLREVPTEDMPATEPGAASWRKYGRR